MRNEENPRAGGSETGDACRQKKWRGFFFLRFFFFFFLIKSPATPPPEVSLRPFSQTISRQHLHPGKEPPAVGKAYFTIESAKHSH